MWPQDAATLVLPLLWMSDPFKRKRTRKGHLKVEQIHQLARDITYGNRGRLKGKSMEDINSSGNCTTLIMAGIHLLAGEGDQ